MGVRSFLKKKMDQHGGPVGLARHAVAKATKGAASADRSADPDPAVQIKEAIARLPKEPDENGYHAVAPSSLLKEGERNTFKVGDIPIACFRIDGRIYVIDDECAHENGPLGEGTVDGFIVTCPYHDWRYDVRNGDCLTDPQRHLSCFAVAEHDGYIWVGGKTREGSASRGGEHDDGLVTRDINER
ncbi:MAG: hypothetical protein D6798_16850 [Deltaproteobacteria bacterium]|nr:MAG: hypothetical protein D6798_16850 [Deltaproteobacteria bacterium]